MTAGDGGRIGDGNWVSDDQAYYRKDDDLVGKLITDAYVCQTFLGLRRFGKTSFLRKVERYCNGFHNSGARFSFDGDEQVAMAAKAKFADRGVRAYFVPCQQASNVASLINQGLKDSSPNIGSKLFLLDDIQGLTNLWLSGAQREFRQDLSEAIELLFAQAEKSGGERVKIVMSEPTNHREWLSGRAPIGLASQGGATSVRANEDEDPPAVRAANVLRTKSGGAAGHVTGHLSTLSDEMAWALLTGAAPGGPGDANRMKREIASQINAKLGGNPWLLSFARDLIRRHSSTMTDDLGLLIRAVHEQSAIDSGGIESATGDRQLGLLTIFNSLTNAQRLVVQLLHSAGLGHPSAVPLFTENEMRRYWNDDDGYNTHRELIQFGIAAHNDGGWAYKLKLEGMDSIIRSSLPSGARAGQGIMDAEDAIDVGLWQSLLSAPHPKTVSSGRTIIHQVSDLLFQRKGADEDSVDNWGRYVEWLKTLPPEKRPHFIVICGNILPGLGSKADLEDYRQDLDHAFNRILEAQHYMRGAGADGAVGRNQFIIVPGVLDLAWQKRVKDKGAWQHAQEWDRLLKKYQFSGARGTDGKLEAVAFPEQRVMFLPIDTTSLKAVNDALGDNASKDLCAIRRRIRHKYADDLATLLRNRRAAEQHATKGASTSKNAKAGDKALKLDYKPADITRDWARFMDHTSRFVVDLEDTTSEEQNEIDDPTFKWAAPGRAGESTTWITEAGFVDNGELGVTLESARQKDAGGPMMKIAVCHHCPQQNRRATLVEFYEAYDFRARLADAGVKWIMHGHTGRARRLMQQDSRFRVDGQAPRLYVTNLLGAGSFFGLKDLMPPQSLAKGIETPSEPTINELEITPPPRSQKSGADDIKVAVRLLRWSDGDSQEPQIVGFE